MPTEEDSLIGLPIGNYVLKSLLGVGGMGAVYLAEHPAIGRQVAIKVLAEHLSLHARLSERFLSEARALALIENPNVIEIYDFGKLEDGRLFYVMELLRGLELGKVMNQRGRLTAAEVLPYLEQICRGLQATHEKGIIHRDLKPENIFVLDRDPMNIKLLDFGIAKLQHQGMGGAGGGGGITLTQTGMVMGTPLYIAPEQASGEVQSIGPQTDLYSLGVIIYWMLSGKPPFFNETPALLLAMHISEEVKPIRQVFPSVPASVAEIVEQCLAKDPAHRPASAKELARRFAEAVHEADAEAAAGEASIPGPSDVRALTSVNGEPAVEISTGEEASTTGPRPAPAPADPDRTVEQAAAEGAPPTSAMPAAGEGSSTLPSSEEDPGRAHLTMPVPISSRSDMAATTPVPSELEDELAGGPDQGGPSGTSQPPHQPVFTPPPFEEARRVGPSSTEITAELPEAQAAIEEAAQAALEAPMGHTQVRTTLRGGAGELLPAKGRPRRPLLLAGALAAALLLTGVFLLFTLADKDNPAPLPTSSALPRPDLGSADMAPASTDSAQAAVKDPVPGRKMPKKRRPRPAPQATSPQPGPGGAKDKPDFPDPFTTPPKKPAQPKPPKPAPARAKKTREDKPKKIGEGTMEF